MPQPVSSTIADSRRAHRVKTFLPAMLYVGSASQPIHILDLSVSGARIHCWTELPQAAVRICCGDLQASGRVVWSKGKKHGIQFDRKLTHQVLALLADDRSPLRPL